MPPVLKSTFKFWILTPIAKQGASMEEIIAATTMAEIHEKILTFSDGYDTVVGERGLKQRSLSLNPFNHWLKGFSIQK